MPSGCAGTHAASPSISIRPTIRRTVHSSCPSSIRTTTRVLPAGDGLCQFQRRGRTVSVCGCTASRQRDRTVGAVGILPPPADDGPPLFSGARIRIRLDGGFAHPGLLDFLDAEPNLEYVVADG